MRDNGPVTQKAVELAHGDILVSRTDLRGVISFANDAFVSISGFSREELLGQSHNLVRHPDMPAAAFADLWQTLKAGQCWVGVVKNRCQNGDHYWVRAAVSPYSENGKVTGYISVRTKPSAEEVATADRAYAAIRAGRGGVGVRRGRVVATGLTACCGERRARLGFRLATALSVLAILAAASGVLAYLARGQDQCLSIAGMITAGAGVLVALGAVFVLPRQFGLRMTAVRQLLDAMAAGRRNETLDLDLQDEFGPVMLSVAALQTQLAYGELSQREIRARTMSAFDSSVGGVIAGMSTSIKSMQGTAQSQSSVAGQVAGNAQTVAASASELNASIKEIATQASQVSELARAAAQTADSSRSTMASLEKAAGEITAVAKLIADIAEQTNLLALNATIEAARAGDAGRGFAVVAGEVKSLANQTHGATGDINRKIAAVQGDAQAAVTALGSVAASIGKLNDAAHAIAAAVEEQSAVVDEVARNAEQAAAAAKETGAAAAAVSEAATSLAGSEVALGKAVTAFKTGLG